MDTNLACLEILKRIIITFGQCTMLTDLHVYGTADFS